MLANIRVKSVIWTHFDYHDWTKSKIFLAETILRQLSSKPKSKEKIINGWNVHQWKRKCRRSKSESHISANKGVYWHRSNMRSSVSSLYISGTHYKELKSMIRSEGFHQISGAISITAWPGVEVVHEDVQVKSAVQVFGWRHRLIVLERMREEIERTVPHYMVQLFNRVPITHGNDMTSRK